MDECIYCKERGALGTKGIDLCGELSIVSLRMPWQSSRDNTSCGAKVITVRILDESVGSRQGYRASITCRSRIDASKVSGAYRAEEVLGVDVHIGQRKCWAWTRISGRVSAERGRARPVSILMPFA